GGGGEASRREGVHQYVADDALTDEYYRNHPKSAAQAALARRAGAELVRSTGRARAADSVSRRLLPDFHFGFGQEIKSDQTTIRRGQDFAGRSGRRCTCGRRATRQSAVAHRQDLSPDRSAVREHAFLCTGVFEGAWPHDHLSGHSGRAVAGRAARSRLAGSPGEPPRDNGRSAPRGTVRPNVGRRAHVNGATAAERAGARQEKCGDIHRIGKSSLSVFGCSHSTNLTFDLVELHGLKWFNFSMRPTRSLSSATAIAVIALIGGWSNVTWQYLGLRRSTLKFVQDRLVSIVLMPNSFGS